MPTLEEIIAGAGLANLGCNDQGTKKVLQGIDLARRLSYEESLRQGYRNLYDVLRFSADTARDNQEVNFTGDFIEVEHYPGVIPFSIRLNERDAPSIGLRTKRSITAPFYRFFISNSAGAGTLVLNVGAGTRMQSADIVDIA